MKIETMSPVSMGNVERAHSAMNAAYNTLAVDTTRDTIPENVNLARGYLSEARGELVPGAGHEGPCEAAVAARAVLPRIERAFQLLDALGASRDPHHVAPLLDEIGIAMDHVEAALAAIGWD